MIKVEYRGPYYDEYDWNKELRIRHDEDFMRAFSVSVAKFMHPYWGFDVIRFDEWLRTPDGKSTDEFLQEKYGGVACDLVKALIAPIPKPDKVQTWVNMDYDIAAQNSTGFSSCRYDLPLTRGGRMTGDGYYKDGLIVHRSHYRYAPYDQVMDGNWQVTTSQGVFVAECKSFSDAKKKAAQMAPAIDFTVAQTLNLTAEQLAAISRVLKFWNGV